jgi:arylsulfatase A-like enzyme
LRSSLGATLLLCTPVLLLAACTPDEPELEAVDRPNVVLILIDTLRADKLSSYGHPCDPSPALTRLAAGGVQFDSVLSQTSWTLPSVGSMLTSRHPRSLGLYDERGVLLDDHEMLAEILQRAGYTTFGATANPNLNRRTGIPQGFDAYEDSQFVFNFMLEEMEAGKPMHEHGAALTSAREVFGKALSFVDAAPEGHPFYLQLNVMEVHEYMYPSMGRPEYAQGFEGCDSPAYLRRVRQVTDDVEEFVNALRSRSGWEDTLFVVTSDHGEGLDDHPGIPNSRGHGALLYGSQVRVPWLMFSETWSPARGNVTQDVRLLDMLPTIVDFVGLPAPTDAEGVSLMPLLEGRVESAPLPEIMVSETTFREFWKLSARSGEFVYVHNRDEHQGMPEHELQRLDTTPVGIKTDVSGEHAAEMERLRRYLATWEREHEQAAATTAELSEAECIQLEQIGYLR